MKAKSTSQIARMLTRNAILLTVTALALCASPTIALADGCIGQTTWTGAIDNNWFTAGNWSNGVPTVGDTAEIDNGGTANINSAGAVACNLILGFNAADTGYVSVNGGGLTVGSEVEVGAHGQGTLTITNGATITAGLLTIAALQNVSGSPSMGTVSVDGSTFTASGRCDVGGDDGTLGGIALLSIMNSGTVSAANVHVYNSGTLSGNNSTVSTTNGTTIDGTIEPSSGRLTISSGNLTFTSTALMLSKVTPTSADNVYVSPGAATLSGKLSVSMSGTFTPGMTYTLLHADGGLGHTTFSSVSITYPTCQCFTPKIQYDYTNNNVNLVLNPAPCCTQ
jgi:T5SS/PEP-CTERM-associated repeat protein